MSEAKIKKTFKEVLNNPNTFETILKKMKVLNLSSVTGLTSTAKVLLVSYIAEKTQRPIVYVSSTISGSLSFLSKFENISNKTAKYLPEQESSPYQLVYSDINVLNDELNTLRDFQKGSIDVLVSSAKHLTSVYPSESFYKDYSVNLAVKKQKDPYKLAEYLVELGYKRTALVTDPGEFSLRGDILDIYPLTNLPVRIGFWGDDIENIRYFNPETQRTVRKVSFITIEPRYKIVLTDKNVEILKNKLLEEFEKSANLINEEASETLEVQIDSINTSLDVDRYFEGVEYYSSYINPEIASVFDFIPENTLIICDESHDVFSKIELQDKKYTDEYKQQLTEGFALPVETAHHLSSEQISKKLKGFSNLSLDSFIQDDNSTQFKIDCALVSRFSSDPLEAAAYIASLRSQKMTVLVASEYPNRISEILNDVECPNLILSGSIDPGQILNQNDVIIFKSSLSEGFISKDLNLALITDTELFNRKLKKPTIAKKLSSKENIDFIDSLKELKPNDYVVHLSHGIGRFIGMSKQEIDGQEKDYLTIEYAKGDKLYMPAEQVNMLSRYRGGGDSTPGLSKMGGADWQGAKRKVRKAIEDIAQDLLNLYAKRAKKEGFQADADSPWQLELEDSFSFTETPDQLTAIQETKANMESPKPMDRLICGDVGFGKTEVAIRAIFKAVLSGKQVAMLVPTTILAQQHFLTLSERLKPYPVKIELLSRFRTPKQAKQTINNLITGQCDVVIGTHKLLQKDVEFKDLGLLVIDEEHRFGVKHKEKLKHLRENIDVLSLSATPIPRTLYMSLSGMRDMSLINTPPVNRAPVKTFVGYYNESYVKTAINHELEREGQVYFLYNRVQTIYKFAKDIEKLVPNARIAVAHGQMKEKELEQIMYDFSVHNCDILICTTIIESGLDIPNANTMLIYNADRFGLAQLYQIRGRVGRSERQAYAYCFYKKDKVLTQEAKNRLQAIKDFTTLGSGYQIALRDLEIRGVGNLLGAKQHGHMLSVGFDMYCSLLEETIKELKGEHVNKKDPPIIDINITAYIPDEWIGDKNQKMIEYKRLADVRNVKELEAIEVEWRDRFGKIPDVVIPLMNIIKLRLMASEIGINLVRETYSNVRIYTDYRFNEWEKIKNTLPKELTRKLKWTKAPATSELGSSVILMDNSLLTSNELLDILNDLFYYIAQLQKTFTQKENI